MRATMIAVIFAFATASAFASEPPPFIEAWCDGGIDGRFQHATVGVDGLIRATNDWHGERPWPVVGRDSDSAQVWFAAIEAAEPALPPGSEFPVVADGIVCGLVLNMGQEAVPYDLPAIRDEILTWVPGYH